MRGADLVDEHLECRPAPHERPRRARVVEVDVGEQQRPRGLARERGHQRVGAGLRAGVDEHVADLPAADHAITSEMLYVDLAHGFWSLVASR